MPFYLFQVAYTPEAFKAMLASPTDRRAAAEKVLAAVGGKVHHFFFAFGKYDAVVIIEAPDDKAMAAAAMAVAAGGACSSGQTIKLITVEEGMEAMKLGATAGASYQPPTA